MSRTWSSSVTSASIVSSPSEPGLTSTPTTRAPCSAKSRAVSAPMPLAAPVITHTFPSSLPAICLSLLGRVEDVLDLGVVLERVGPELAADAGLLEAPERGRDADRGVRVDREHAGLDRARDAQRLGAVARPDRARTARRSCRSRSRPPRARRRTGSRTRPGPKISSRRPGRSSTPERARSAGTSTRARRAPCPRIATGASSGTKEATVSRWPGRDQRPHLGAVVERIADAQRLHGPLRAPRGTGRRPSARRGSASGRSSPGRRCRTRRAAPRRRPAPGRRRRRPRWPTSRPARASPA